PTESGLQPVFPLESGREYGTPHRIDDGWIVREITTTGDIWWQWRDSDPEPIRFESGGNFLQYEKNNVAFFETGYLYGTNVKVELGASVDGNITELSSIADMDRVEFRAEIVGETKDQIVVAAATQGPQAELKIFRWDGTSDGLTPLDTVNRFIEENQLYDFQNHEIANTIRVIMRDDAALLIHRGSIYRIPLSEQTIVLDQSFHTVNIKDSEISIQENTDQEFDGSNSSGLTTIDAQDVDRGLEIIIDGKNSLPLHGIRVLAPQDAKVYLSPLNIDSPITYQFSENVVTMTVEGRKIWFEFEGEFEIVERGSNSDEEIRRDRNVLVQSTRTSASLYSAFGETVAEAIGSYGLARVIMQGNIGTMRTIGMDAEQFIYVATGSEIERIELVSGNSEPLDLAFAFPSEIHIDSTVTESNGGRRVIAKMPETELMLDITQSPLHNPFVGFDADGNNDVTPADILTVINHLAEKRGYEVSDQTLFPDVSGDRQVTPLDILEVINYLADKAAPSGEMASATPLNATPANDFVMSNWNDDDDDQREVARLEHASLF
ncbi:MAG: dockerin type I domain-containing protein, partial [Rubripirellula sp.]